MPALLFHEVLAQELQEEFGEKLKDANPEAKLAFTEYEKVLEKAKEKFPGYNGNLEQAKELNETVLPALYNVVHSLNDPRTAVCLSGGGIRSATFGLGVLQALARWKMLDKFDYLSTVSGGGFIGGWLSAWIHHTNGDTARVQADLLNPSAEKCVAEPVQLTRLRSYSNYMTPQHGLFSADTWTLVAVYFRNLLLNWLVLVPLFAAFLLAPRILYAVTHSLAWRSFKLPPFGLLTQSRLLLIGILLGIFAISYVIACRPSLDSKSGFITKRLGQGSVLFYGVLFLIIWAYICTNFWFWYLQNNSVHPIHFLTEASWFVSLNATLPYLMLPFLVFGLALHALGFLFYYILFRGGSRTVKNFFGEFAIAIVNGLVGGLLTWLIATELFNNYEDHPRLYSCIAVPALLLLFITALTLFVGLASRITEDKDREWLARFAGWMLIFALLWFALHAIVLYGPDGLKWIWMPSTRGWIWKSLLTAVGGISGFITLAGGYFSRFFNKDKEAEKKSESKFTWLIDIAPKIAAPVFALFLLVLLAHVTDYLLRFGWGNYGVRVLICSLVLLALFGSIMGFFINVNKFSLHGAYRDRLIRAYLGASRSHRDPNPFTGFDEKDNLEMHELKQTKPLHIINQTLNLVRGRNLAWQNRKAESYTMSKLHCGSYEIGYRNSYDYAKSSLMNWITKQQKKRAITLGTAVAISGAAASPNMGYYSSPIVTFLMAVFNVRLGWWLGNTGPAGNDTYEKAGPTFAARPLVEETLGMTDDCNPYIYLSDGGHFENLALYEMVRRRCRLIVVSDAGCDLDFDFDDFSNALEKIRVDLGVPINVSPDMIKIYPPNAETLPTDKAKYCAAARISYSKVDGVNAFDGLLIYIKPTLYGLEPLDVIHYAKENPTFPHQTTADQFFSEDQFESYRTLGFYEGYRAFANLQKRQDENKPENKKRTDEFFGLEEIFNGLKRGNIDNKKFNKLLNKAINELGIPEFVKPKTETEIIEDPEWYGRLVV